MNHFWRSKRVFLDLNIVIELLDSSAEISNDILDVITDLIHNDYDILTSSETIIMIYHAVSDKEEIPHITSKLKNLLNIFKVVPANEEIIYKTLELVERNGVDFENRIQYLTAIHYNCDLFITNNSDFKSEVPFEIIEL
jgi:predicted nucleic acid-binding protein